MLKRVEMPLAKCLGRKLKFEIDNLFTRHFNGLYKNCTKMFIHDPPTDRTSRKTSQLHIVQASW